MRLDIHWNWFNLHKKRPESGAHPTEWLWFPRFATTNTRAVVIDWGYGQLYVGLLKRSWDDTR